jgi:hypothetical protein
VMRHMSGEGDSLERSCRGAGSCGPHPGPKERSMKESVPVAGEVETTRGTTAEARKLSNASSPVRSHDRPSR